MTSSVVSTPVFRAGLFLALVTLLAGLVTMGPIRSAALHGAVQREQGRLERLAVVCAESVEIRGTTLHWPGRRAFAPVGVNAVVLDEDGAVVAGPPPGGDVDDDLRLTVYAPIPPESAVAAPALRLRLSAPLDAVEAPVRDAFGRIAIVFTIVFATSILTAWIAGRRSARRSTRLIEDVERLAAGDLRHRLQTSESDEDPLATQLDRMAGQLQSRFGQLSKLSAEQQAILQAMSSGLLAIDPEQHVLSMNRAAATILDVEAESSRGRLVQEIIREPLLNGFLRDAVNAERSIMDEFRLERGAAGTLTVKATSALLRDAGGRTSGLLVVLDDVTKIRQLESLRSDFAANVSHELRTPITNIKGYVETLMDVGVDDRDQAERFLEIIGRNAQRLAAIIEDLLSLARLEQPDMRENLDAKVVPVVELVRAVVSQVQSAASDKQITVRSSVPPELRVRVVSSLVEQAVGNLISNAITYSPAGTTVRVRAEERDDGLVEIQVSDQGPGIPAHHLPRLFERFYRVDKARSREQGGTGLGLAIVKHIALVHGGNVRVESRIGVGSTFFLSLPGVVHA